MRNKKNPVPCVDYSDLNNGSRNPSTRTLPGLQWLSSLVGYHPASVSNYGLKSEVLSRSLSWDRGKSRSSFTYVVMEKEVNCLYAITVHVRINWSELAYQIAVCRRYQTRAIKAGEELKKFKSISRAGYLLRMKANKGNWRSMGFFLYLPKSLQGIKMNEYLFPHPRLNSLGSFSSPPVCSFAHGRIPRAKTAQVHKARA